MNSFAALPSKHFLVKCRDIISHFDAVTLHLEYNHSSEQLLYTGAHGLLLYFNIVLAYVTRLRDTYDIETKPDSIPFED